MSSSINFLGSYSGIDQTTIDSLMEVEKAPLIQMAEQKESYETEQNAWRDINTRLDNLMTKVRDLQIGSVFEGKSVSSTDTDTASASATSSALNGTYEIEVERLASSSRIIGTKILADGDTNNTELGITGSFTITNGDGDLAEISVEATDTLSSISEKINDLNDDIAISATLVDGRLVLSDDNMGARQLILANTDGAPLSELGLDVSDPLLVVETGTSALFTINGIEVERDSNTVSDAVEGLTLTLGAETADGQVEKIYVSNNTEAAVEKIEAFIEQYNSTLTFMQEASDAGDYETEESGGALAGDSTLQRMISTLRTMVSSSISGLDSSYSNASQLGITTIDKDGLLELDSSKLTAALEDDSQAVSNFFHDTDTESEEIGLSAKLETYINSLIASGTGIVEIREDGLESTLATLNDSIEAFNDRMELREAYYTSKFAALDVALQLAESTLSALTSQLESLSTGD